MEENNEQFAERIFRAAGLRPCRDCGTVWTRAPFLCVRCDADRIRAAVDRVRAAPHRRDVPSLDEIRE